MNTNPIIRTRPLQGDLLAVVVGIILAGLSPVKVSAQIIVDQSNLGVTGYVLNEVYTSNPATYLSQSFIPTMNNIAGAYVEIYPNGYPSNVADTVTMTLYAVNPAIDASSPLVTASAIIPAGGGGGVSVYWTPVAVTPGNTYFLRLQNSLSGNQINLTGNAVAIPGLDQYTNGAMWVDTSVWWGGGYSTWDLVFKTYGDSAIPEPSTYAALAGAAALGLALFRRRKTPA